MQDVADQTCDQHHIDIEIVQIDRKGTNDT
jgi:hypothetical protein